MHKISHVEKLLLLIIIVIVLSCNNKKIIKDIDTNERLLSFSSKYITDYPDSIDAYMPDHENYIDEKQVNDTLFITTIERENAGGKVIGDIEFHNDTLILVANEMAEELCTCIAYSEYKYKVYNPKKIKYKIVRDYRTINFGRN